MFLKSFWAGALGSVLLAAVGCNIKVERADGDTEGGAPSATGGSASSSGGETTASGGALAAMGGVGGTSAAGGVGGAAPGIVEDCSGQILKTRIDTAHAAALAGGATLCVKGTGPDYLFIDTPKDAGAHIFKMLVAPDADADVNIEAAAQSDSSSLGSFYTTNGSRTLWLVLTGGTRTFLKITPFSNGGRVVLTPTWVDSQDPYEPNDSKDTAALVTVNQDVTAQLQRPYTTAADTTCADWYKVNLAAGAHTLTFSHVPDDARPDVAIVGPSGTNVASAYARNNGALFDIAFTAATAGTYTISLSDFDGCPPSFYVGSSLDSLTDVYTFKIVE